MKRYSLMIDHTSCWGCKTCEVACKQEHDPGHGVRFIQVWEDGPKLIDGRLDTIFRVSICQHCESPPCAEVCPVEAITQREDGIVILNEEHCTGCQACIAACPFGAIVFEPEKKIARKCNLCYQRVDQGLFPACADNICLAHCIYFGEAEDIQKMRMARSAHHEK